MNKERDYIFDNSKGVLTFLVVYGHLIEYFIFRSSEAVQYIYSGIYMFHMPIFVFISGYFSKKNSEKRIIQLFVTYMLWQKIIFPLVTSIMMGTSYSDELNAIFHPEGSYWYVLSLVIWKLIVPYFSHIKFSFIIAILAGVLVGTTEMKMNLSLFSFGRTVVFFPFFIAGYFVTKERLYQIINRIKKHWGIILFIIVTMIGIYILYGSKDFLLEEKYINRILYGKYIYKNIYGRDLVGIVVRFMLYIVQFALIILFFTFMPDTNTIFTRFSRKSLAIYLTHFMLFRYINETYLKEIVYVDGMTVLCIGLIVTLVYCIFFSSGFITKIFSNITPVNIDKLLKK